MFILSVGSWHTACSYTEFCNGKMAGLVRGSGLVYCGGSGPMDSEVEFCIIPGTPVVDFKTYILQVSSEITEHLSPSFFYPIIYHISTYVRQACSWSQ